MPALPKATSDEPQAMNAVDPNFLSAYRICLQHELDATNDDERRHARLLGFLLLKAPNRDIIHEVSNCIHSREIEKDFFRLAEFFEMYFIRTFMKNKGKTPFPSHHPSRPSFESSKARAKVDIKQAPKNHQDAKDRALIRDNWRCPVTGILHLGAPADVHAMLGPEEMAVNTECGHIIPEAAFFGVDPKTEDNRKLDYSASVLAVLQRFRYDISTFNGEKIHSLTNVITMQKDIHDLFDRLQLYFEPTKQDNSYKVKSCTGYRIPNAREFVIFTTDDPEHLAVPSPELLALHATCCKVAHLCGSAEYIDQVYHDAERMGVLASDGSSADMLNYSLLSMSNSIDDRLD